MKTTTKQNAMGGAGALARAVAWMVVMALVAFASGRAVAQSSITLRTNASAKPGMPVTLAQIATLEGPEAVALGQVVVGYSKAGVPLKLDLQHVRSALAAPGISVNWARVTLSGKTCDVREDASIDSPATASKMGDSQPVAVDIEVETPRVLIAKHLATIFNVESRDLRIKLSANGMASDMAWFDQPTDSFSRYDLIEISSARVARASMRIEQFRGDRLVSSRTVMIDALVRREVVVASSTIQRDQSITHEMVTLSEQWLSPSTPVIADVTQVVGATPRFRIDAGKVITASDVQTPMIVSRGETVWIDVATGGLLVKAKAKALGSARDGQLVQLQMDGSKKPVTARMAGRGRAVMELAPSPDQDANEAGILASPTRRKP